jgi:carboxy-cis,cis-muconate cyclase
MADFYVAGHILSLVAREPTTTKGGIANAIAPMDVDNDDGSVDGKEGSKVEYAAMTDVPTRYVEVWRLDAEVGKLEVVAHLGINDGGCCANVVWLD